MRALVHQRRATPFAEAACGSSSLVFVARDVVLPRDDPKAFAPTADIGRIDGAVRKAARAGMIVPGPARRIIDLEAHGPAQAAAGDARRIGKLSSFHRSSGRGVLLDSHYSGNTDNNAG